MIGRLHGVLLEKQAPELLVDVNGVGYELQAPLSTFYELPAVGATVTLHIHHVAREDAQVLYAFAGKDERRLFRSLIKVNGVGPKLALTILSGIEADQFVNCVHNNDTAALVKLPGVGKKTAERLLVEMRDRLADWEVTSANVAAKPEQGTNRNLLVDEAESALLALGYKPQEASRAISGVDPESYATAEELIRQALKSMVKA